MGVGPKSEHPEGPNGPEHYAVAALTQPGGYRHGVPDDAQHGQGKAQHRRLGEDPRELRPTVSPVAVEHGRVVGVHIDDDQVAH